MAHKKEQKKNENPLAVSKLMQGEVDSREEEKRKENRRIQGQKTVWQEIDHVELMK